LDVFWFDACWWGGMFTAKIWDSEKLTRMVRKLQPGIIINNRVCIPGDFDTPEQKIGIHYSSTMKNYPYLRDSVQILGN